MHAAASEVCCLLVRALAALVGTDNFVFVHTTRFAQMSCASWRWGYFNVYNMTSRVLDLDVIVFLGDWIYEYSDQQYPASGQGGPPDAAKCSCHQPRWSVWSVVLSAISNGLRRLENIVMVPCPVMLLVYFFAGVQFL